jgi:hypothetical protein
MRSSRGEGGAGVVREKLEAEGGGGNSSSCLTSLSYIFSRDVHDSSPALTWIEGAKSGVGSERVFVGLWRGSDSCPLFWWECRPSCECQGALCASDAPKVRALSIGARKATRHPAPRSTFKYTKTLPAIPYLPLLGFGCEPLSSTLDVLECNANE